MSKPNVHHSLPLTFNLVSSMAQSALLCSCLDKGFKEFSEHQYLKFFFEDSSLEFGNNYFPPNPSFYNLC